MTFFGRGTRVSAPGEDSSGGELIGQDRQPRIDLRAVVAAYPRPKLRLPQFALHGGPGGGIRRRQRSMGMLDQLVDFGWVVSAENNHELDVRHPSRLPGLHTRP
jgi:hypothetical protein